ncbi:MAG: L-serine ammonia-lyase, iron-sulfur-dependent, subunit alpha [Proteobacteria bacterium]|nr:L-serine ammonia-lyase, iron-sulfur-dependent, subunit alpha [Pseudomonadota bacterium]MBU1695838.1 L-serine ammonia-lyase, iron-sulfur-dependent, subunit alpha [Pseudomonadota bacterium]
MINLSKVIERLEKELSKRILTLGELIEIAEEEDFLLSHVVVAEAMVKEGKSYEEILSDVMGEFDHNLKALEIGLTKGRSFILGTVGSDLAKYGDDKVLINDSLINKALIYTLATEVGNHEIGLQPCAGTGDSCPYTGLIRALKEEGYSQEKIALAAALTLKVGSIFRAGKQTTGCNMEGFGAGAAAAAAALTDLRGGTARQVSKAVVLAISPTIAVPCTPRVMAAGLCATHISGAILIGNQAANLILKTSLPVDIDVDVMIAMAARIHVEAAPVITAINLEYLEPYFQKNNQVELFVDEDIRNSEKNKANRIKKQAREEIRNLIASSRPLTNVFGDVVVGGSSIAVGSPTNMARICHAMLKGEIKKIEIDLTVDLFSRRAINIPAILMGAIYGAKTDDAQLYHKIFELPEIKNIEVKINKVNIPQVQRIRIEATETSAYVDAKNRGGGRVAIVDAEPSLKQAIIAAKRLGIELVD